MVFVEVVVVVVIASLSESVPNVGHFDIFTVRIVGTHLQDQVLFVLLEFSLGDLLHNIR